MTMLAELNITKIGTFKNRAGEVVWTSTDDVRWTGSSILYTSLEGFAGDHYWDELIATITPPQYTMPQLYGGHCKIPFGSIEFSAKMVDESPLWPPPINYEITLYYAALTESGKEKLFQGMAHIAGFTRKTVTYDLYAENLDAVLLEEAEDYNGDTVPLPRALGTIQHQNPVRLPDVGGKPTYHKAYLTGTVNVDWHVYDDGVNIDANVTDNGDGTFSLSATPVGEVTTSGTGEIATISDIVEWACDPTRLNQNFDNTYAESPSPEIWHWANSQQVLIEFISDICASVLHLTYTSDQTLYLVHLNEDNGSRTLTGEDFAPVQYDYDPPVSQITAEWVVRTAVEETIGKYIKETSKETTVFSNYKYGEKMTVTPYHTDKTTIDARLAAILELIHKPTISVPVVMVGSLPVPGERIDFTDQATVRDLAVSFNSWNIVYDFKKHQYSAEGKGTLS